MDTKPLCYVAVALALITASAARAHDTWLLPDRFEVAPNETVVVDLTSGMEFPKLETGPKRERVQTAQCRLAGRTFEISDIKAGAKALVLRTALPDEGIAAIWVKLPPRALELKPKDVEHYFEEVDPPASVRKQWAEAKEPRRWRELYTKHQKTFVRVGNAEGDRSWAEPVGSALEIVPEKDPTALRAGDDLPVRVLKDGAPHADFALNAVAAGETKGETRRTDADGRVVFRLAKPGRYLVRGTDLRKSTQRDTDWESDFVTLTLEAKAQ